MKKFFLMLALISFSSARAGECDLPLEGPLGIQEHRLKQLKKVFPNVKNEQIHFNGKYGRIDLNVDVNFSYYVQISDFEKPDSEMILIPMASSRLAPAYVSTPEWWKANEALIKAAKAEKKSVPYQDRNEVKAWLLSNNLSTNPWVYKIKNGVVTQVKLKDFLLDRILKTAKNDKVSFFRGAEREGELASWKSGVRPRGARYWTPSANYAWRYGRKDGAFLEKLINNETPIIKFEIPVSEVRRLVNKGDLVLGTELTQKTHSSFDNGGEFLDHLLGNTPYLAEGDLGVEIEIRGNGRGASELTSFFSSAATVDDLAISRREKIEKGYTRLMKIFPQRKSQFLEEKTQRLKMLEWEQQVIKALQSKESKGTLQDLQKSMPAGAFEISNNDFQSLKQLLLVAIEEMK